MNIDNDQVKKVLLEGGYVTDEDIQQAEKYAKAHRTSATDYLMAQGLITEDIVGQAMAEFFKVSYADLNSHQPPREQVLKIPEEIARKFRVVLFQVGKKSLTITSDYPKQNGLAVKLKNLFPSHSITVSYSLPNDIDTSFIHYRKSLQTRFAKILEEQERVAPEIIDEIFEDALVSRASDIHFEPQEKEVVQI
jgi:type II secretory ATPase GspE/PulE/Tfp pilus assembly ATPase PilB-like protein